MTGDERPYELVVAGPAAHDLSERLPEPVAVAVLDLITGALLEDPHRVGRPLRRELADLWSARKGTFRVIYRIDDDARVVTILRIEHRRDVYRGR